LLLFFFLPGPLAHRYTFIGYKSLSVHIILYYKNCRE
jgi:hypothetical protein